MPTATDAAALQLILADLSTEAIADLVALWRQYSDDPELAALLLAAFPEIIGPYTQAGGLVSAQWYTELAPDLAYIAEPFVDLPDERLTGSVKWALYAPGAATPLERLSGSVKRMIYDSSRQTVLHNLSTEYGDPPGVSFDDQPGTRWARYASADACSFCKMLTTRAAVYRSRESAERVTGRSVDITDADRRHIAAGQTTRDEALARRATYSNARAARKAGKSVGDRKTRRLRGNGGYGSKYHDHCRCIAVPVRPGTSYEPPDYVHQWEDDYVAATRAVSTSGGDSGGKSELKAILREMDARERDRQNGAVPAPIDMVEIELAGGNGETVTKRVPADSPAARAHAKRRSQQTPPTAGGNGGGPTKPPVGPPTSGSSGAADPDEPPWSGHTKGYVHPHRAPIWSESERQRRQRELRIERHGEQLHQHEIETVERLIDRGEQLEWIPRDDRLPTNDFRWLSREGIEVDTKSTKAKYKTIRNQLQRGVEKARAAREQGEDVRKDNYLVDIGRARLNPTLENQLSDYNQRNPENRISRLWVLSVDGRNLTEIQLR